MVFGIYFRGFWLLFCSSICRMPTPPGTKRNNGKRQEHADNCRNMQKSNATNNANIKTPIENLQAAECNQLQQTPIFKIGGGGARAARRIRIRRPRLAERGARRVKLFCKTCPKTCKTARKTLPRTTALLADPPKNVHPFSF